LVGIQYPGTVATTESGNRKAIDNVYMYVYDAYVFQNILPWFLTAVSVLSLSI
jgi:hypothetical protein